MKNQTSTHLPDPQVNFIASLSNGQTVIEGKNDWAWIDGKPSPWQRLIRYALDNKLTITSLSLFTPDGQTYTLPPASGKPKFAGYSRITEDERPIDFEVKRFLARDIEGFRTNKAAEIQKVAIAEFYTIAEAIYKDYTVQIWVNELNTYHSWVAIKKND